MHIMPRNTISWSYSGKDEHNFSKINNNKYKELNNKHKELKNSEKKQIR